MKKTVRMASEKSRTVLYLESIGLLTGMILGAGIFALPFVFSRAGIFWGLLHFISALFLIIILNFLYGEAAFLTAGRHRFTGYVKMYLGKSASYLAFLVTILSYYGTFLIYGLLGGIFLENIFNGGRGSFNTFWFSLLFFAAAGIFSFLRFEKIGAVNFYLTVPLLFFILYLAGVSWPLFDFANFKIDYSFNEAWFLPYGVWIFALSGFASLPEARDMMKGASLRDFKKVILWSVLISAFFSLIFALSVLGITGARTSEDALAGLKVFLGRGGMIIGSLIGFLAVFTSYLALIADSKEIFKIDYGVPASLAWLFSFVPPLLLFLSGADSLVTVLSFIGAVGLGIFGIFVLKISEKIESQEAVVSHWRGFFKWLVGAGILLGAVYEVWSILLK
ncbi:MAG: aromatic amino acid transport family protein [Patescibacteria group bacterium]